MKIVAMVLAALVVFAGALAGVLAATGNLNADGLAKLMGKDVKGDAALPKAVDNTDQLADENRKRQMALDEREKKLDERDKQLTQREKDLDDLRTKLDATKSQIEGTLKSNEQEKATQLEAQATTIMNMKPDQAAAMLEKFTVEDQAGILGRIAKPKDRAKILSAMKPEVAARVMMSLQQGSQ